MYFNKSILLIILIHFVILTCFSIEPENEGNSPLAPNIVPPSPTAASLGQFGSIPVGLFTGTANVSIPLFELKSNFLTVPISLSYGSNGIKVDEVASWVGLGWNLNAGGVITRTVMDEPDEESNWYMIENLHEYSAELHDFVITGTDEGWDTQPDLFNFNFNGRSGRFVIERNNGKVHCVPYENLKIELDYSSEIGTIIITDEDGIKYYFGGSACEYSKIVTSGANPGQNMPIKTAWYLNKIEHPSGDYIIFSYINNNYNYLSSINQTFKELFYTESCAGGPSCNSGIVETFTYTRNYITGLTLSSIQTRSNKRIKFISNNNRYDISQGDRLDSIKIYDENNQLAKGFKLFQQNVKSTENIDSRIPSDSTLRYRMYLLSIHEFGSNLTSKEPYTFDYFSTSLPPRLSFAQDHWGYYNGALSNQYFVPHLANLVNFFGTIGGNREANASYSGYGLLKKVTYPTKGYSELQYESNYSLETTETYPEEKESINMHVESNETHQIGLTLYDTTETIPFNQNAIQINCSMALAACWNPDNPPQWKYATIEIKNLSTGNIININKYTLSGYPSGSVTKITLSLDPNQYIYKVDFIKGNIYQFILKVPKACLHAYLSLNYYSEPMRTETTTTNIPAGGVRVLKTIDFDGTKQLIKHYYYNDYNNRNTAFSTQPNLPVYVSYGEYHPSCSVPGDQGICRFIYLNSNSQNTLTNTGSSFIYYPRVTESIGDNFEGGGIEHFFNIMQDVPSYPAWGEYIIGAPYTNSGWNNGTIDHENYFKIDNGNKINIKTVNNYYSNDLSKYFEQRGAVVIKKYTIDVQGPYSITLTQADIQRHYVVCDRDHNHDWVYPIFAGDEFCVLGEMRNVYYWAGHSAGETIIGLNRPYNYDIAEYKVISGFNKLDSIIVTENGMINKTKYFYNSPNHSLPTTIINHDSYGKSLITKYDYSSDYLIQDLSTCIDGQTACLNECQEDYYTCYEGCSIYDKESTEFAECKLACLSTRSECQNNCKDEYDDCNNQLISDRRVLAINLLQNNHILQPAIGQRKYLENKLIASDFKEYLVQDNTAYPSVVNQLESLTPILSDDSSYIDNNNVLHILQNLEPKIYFDKYDDKGNILQFHSTHDINTSFIWAYNENLPVVKIEGIKYADIPIAVINAIHEHVFSYSSNYTEVKTDVDFLKGQLSSIISNKNYNVSIYTYSPLLGMTSETNPNGLTSYYTYDEFGRLSLIRNDDGNILKTIEYNYK